MKIGFLQEAEGVGSATRMIFVFGSFWNMILCSYLALTGTEPAVLLATFAGIEGSLGALKIGQKIYGEKN